MSLSDEQELFLLDVIKLIPFAIAQGFKVTGGELFRTPEQQQLYVSSGKSHTLASKHLERLAIDLNFIKNGVAVYDKKMLQQIGDFWETLSPNNSWGGNWISFCDTPHFQRGR